MVRHVFGFVYKEVRGLHQAAYVLALFAFISQLLALVRDRLLANQFGAGEALDIYYTAFRIPDVLFVLFASTLSVYVLIPFITSARASGGDGAARNLLAQVATLFLLAYSTLALVLIMAAPWYVPRLFPGIGDVTTLTTLVQILLLQPFLLGLSNLLGVVTQIAHRFVLYALSPLLYNLGIIGGIMFLYPLWGLSGIAWGVVIGALMHAAVQWPLLRGSELRFGLTHRFDWSALGRILQVSLPRALTLSLNQLVLLVMVSIAGGLAIGSVAVFQFAFNLQSVPLAVIGVSYSVAAFPSLAQLFAEKQTERFAAYIMTALRHIIFWSVPVIVLCIILRAQLVRVILGTGAFDWEDTRLTAAVFAVLILSLVSHGINLLLIRAFYAGGNTRTPLLVTLATAAVGVGAAVALTTWYSVQSSFAQFVAGALRVSDVAGTEVVMLALAYTTAVFLQSALLLYYAHRTFGLSLQQLGRQILNATFAAIFGGIGAYAALQFLVDGLNVETFLGIFLQGLLAGMFGFVGVVIAYFMVGSPELREIGRALNRRLFRAAATGPQQEVLEQ